MFLRSGVLAVLLSLFSTSSFSAVLTIDFTAHITTLNGSGMGYQVGDSISGSYVIDASKAQGQFGIPSPTEASYYGSDTSGLASSSFNVAPTGYLDMVMVNHDNPYMLDKLAIMKVIDLQSSFLDVVGSEFSFLGVNWLHDLDLNNIDFFTNDTALLANSTGGFSRWDVNNWYSVDGVAFTYDSVRMVSSSVPEPAGVALFALGILGVGIRRIFSAA